MRLRSWALIVVVATGCAASTSDPATDPACQLDSRSEKSPGFPFDVEVFGSTVMPVLAQSCGAGGCHAPPGSGSLTIWARAKPGDCDFAKTFNSVVTKIDLTTPANSRLLAAVTGGSPTHPFTFQPTAPGLATLTGFVDKAAAAFAADGGGQTPPPGPSPYDYKVYQQTIAPQLESCATAGCHASGQGGFTLKPGAAPESDDMKANFIAVTSRGNLVDPAKSVIYVRATVQHASGTSKVLAAPDAKSLLDWIEDAKKNAGTNPNPTCAPLDKFNVGVFASELVPILAGDLDLNQPGGQGRGAGCMSGVCHGVDRGPGKLSLLRTDDSAKQLQNFACFVNLAAPAASEILACPLNNPGCRNYPHPGQDVLGGATDLNFQRILAFLYGTKADVSPLDFAFFVRRINTIFNDVNAVEGGAQGRSCADAIGCHGIAVAGQSAPNGSDFPIIANASTLDRLSLNFVAATGFVNFLNPEASSLFLYPTDEIANLARPFSTGIPHPGGRDFEVSSVEAQTILQWSRGLRPDRDGFVRNWLVLGDFPASQIADQTLVDEVNATPKILDRNGGSFNRGEWDGLFSDQREVDLDTVFPRTQTSGRVAYAAAYAINTVPRQILAQLAIATNNPVRVYVDGALVSQNDQAGGTTAFITLRAAGTPNAKPPRILVKLLQRASDQRFAFTAQLRDELGRALTETSREVVFTLGPNGGI